MCIRDSFVNQTLDPTRCTPWVPTEDVFDADSNPDGLRCTIFEAMEASLGTDPETGFANRPLDNTGVQYGLGALLSNEISAEDFLTLNREIGGFDSGGQVVSERNNSSAEVIQRAYESGRILGGHGLAEIPIVVLRANLDASGDVHTLGWASAVRERIEAANGSSNLVTWTSIDSSAASLERRALIAIDEWLVAAGASEGTIDAETLTASRPEAVDDLCTEAGNLLASGAATFAEGSACSERALDSLEPRLVAGAPASNHILKCALAPVADFDYAGTLSAEDIAALQTIFPEGVCDYGEPGVGVVPPAETWATYN